MITYDEYNPGSKSRIARSTFHGIERWNCTRASTILGNYQIMVHKIWVQNGQTFMIRRMIQKLVKLMILRSAHVIHTRD